MLKTFLKNYLPLVAIAIVLIGITTYLLLANFIFPSRYKEQWFNAFDDEIFPNEHIMCNTIIYDTALSDISYEGITNADNITPNEESLTIKAFASEEKILDKDNQSAFYTWGNAQFGTVLKNGQLYGLISYNNTEIQASYLVDNANAELLDKHTLDLGIKDITSVNYITTIEDNGSKIDIIQVNTPINYNYVYIDHKAKRCLQYYEISNNTVTYHKFSDYDGEITFFENMETFPMYITKAEEFDEIYSQFVTASALLANNNVTINVNELMKKYEIEE